LTEIGERRGQEKDPPLSICLFRNWAFIHRHTWLSKCGGTPSFWEVILVRLSNCEKA